MGAMCFSNLSVGPANASPRADWGGWATTYALVRLSGPSVSHSTERIETAAHQRYGRAAGGRTLCRARRGVVGSGGELPSSASAQPRSARLYSSTPDGAFRSQHFVVATIRWAHPPGYRLRRRSRRRTNVASRLCRYGGPRGGPGDLPPPPARASTAALGRLPHRHPPIDGPH